MLTGLITDASRDGRHRRLPGVEVRPGSILQARTEAGLTLAQVAAGQVSRTAVHLAETGKNRPTMPTIQLIAERTNKPIEYFLVQPNPELSSNLGEASIQLLERLRAIAVAERFDDLQTAAREAKSQARGSLDAAWASFYLAQALIRLAKPRPALSELYEARRAFEAAGDQWMLVECMDWESAGLHLLEDASALDVAQAALVASRQLQPPNRSLEVRILGRLGSILVGSHDWPKAIDYYTQAIEVAGELKDLSRLGKMYSDLSIAYERLGDLTRARAHSQKAVTIHELLQDRQSVARAENNLGSVLIRQGELGDAREHLNRSLSICEETGLELGKGHVLLSLAELELSGGDPEGARRHLERAREISERANEMGSLALAHQLMGRVAEETGNKTGADREFRSAISILQRAGMPQRLIGCFAAYSKLLQARGDFQGALEQMRQAVVVTRPDLETSKPLVRAETA